jgi:hypothetical protein
MLIHYCKKDFISLNKSFGAKVCIEERRLQELLGSLERDSSSDYTTYLEIIMK